MGIPRGEVLPMIDLISIKEAARLLQVNPMTLRRHESQDGRSCRIYGHEIRVYRVSSLPGSQRRYDRNEIMRVLARLQKAR